MKKQFATAIIISLTLTACASSREINGFSSLAEFGVGFEGLTQKAIEQGIDRRIDASSRDLMDAKPGTIAGDGTRLGALDDETVITIKHYDAIITHTGLLASYFGQLKILSEIDGETAVAESTDAIVSGLASTVTELPDGISGAVGGLAGKLFLARHSRALTRELEKHGSTIRRQLAIQTKALEFLRDRITADERRINESTLGKDLLGAYIDKKPLPGDWAENRKVYLVSKARRASVATKAAALSAKLETSFVALAEGRLEPEDMARLTLELNRTLAELES